MAMERCENKASKIAPCYEDTGFFRRSLVQIFCGATLWALAVSYVVFSSNSLSGYDAYYHIELSKIMLDQGFVVREFPWTTCSIWSEPFFDKEWLFHVSLLPFISIFGKFNGARVAIVCFSVIAAVSWGALLRTLGVKRVFFALLLILFCVGYAFLGRLVLCRPHLFSIIFLPLALTFIVKNGRSSANDYISVFDFYKLGLAITSCVYMLSYVGAWQIIPIAFIFDATRVWKRSESEKFELKRFFGKEIFGFMSLWATVGIAAGLFFSPYFPDNLKAIYLQTVLVLTAKWFGSDGGSQVKQASELTPIATKHILTYIPLFASFAVLLWQLFKKVGLRGVRVATLAMIILASLYLVVTVMSQRFVEYLAPVFAVAAMLFWSEHPSQHWNSYCPFCKDKCRVNDKLGVLRLYALTVALLLGGAFMTNMLAKSVRKDHLLYEDSAAWIGENVKKGSLIFAGGWGDNSVLFYHLPQYRYLVMLEPYFMYAKSPHKYLIWRKISEGRVLDTSAAVKENFKTDIVFVPPKNLKLKYRLLSDDFAELAYEGKSGETIFRLIP